MTYHYRIYTFKNGLGETVFRAKRVGWLPPQLTPWVEETTFRFDWCAIYSNWGSRDGATAAIQRDAEKRHEKARYREKKKLKLVIVEDESVEVE